MTTTPNEPVDNSLTDDDIETAGAPSGAAKMGLGDEKDADGTDGGDADGTDSSDGDSTDSTDGDSKDGGDADGTDA